MLLKKCVAKIVILWCMLAVVGTVEAQVKKSDLAGSWYFDSKPRLASQLNDYLEKAEVPVIDSKIIAIISPHAGYVYSGPIAAYNYKIIKDIDVDVVVVVGFSHKKRYEGIAVFDGDAYETPLGTVNIDKDLTRRLMAESNKIYDNPGAFEGENSIEMQIPFLQVVSKDFSVVLVAIGEQSSENCRILANALSKTLKGRRNFLIVASTDMSHYLPYEEANKIDKRTVSIVKEFNATKLYKENLVYNNSLMCGGAAVCATMLAAKSLGADKIDILKYANSGDTSGKKESVVGYLSAAMYKEKPVTSNQISERKHISGSGGKGENMSMDKGRILSDEQRTRLLKMARETMEAYIKTGERLKPEEDDPLLKRNMGAFVTLHKRGQLRGCIGNIVGTGPLYLTVRNMAIQSSTSDPRFPKVTADELKDIDIEISVLSELERIDDPTIIEMGRHGVLVKSEFRSGVYLPQVGTETGWSRDEFMSSLCSQKAGLRPDAWKTGNCEIYVFTAEVFGEKE